MVPKPLSKSKATSFYATLKFLVSKKKVENFEISEKMLRVGKVRTKKAISISKWALQR